MAALGIHCCSMAWPALNRPTQRLYNLICFIQLPLFFRLDVCHERLRRLARVAADLFPPDRRIAAVASIASFALGGTFAGEWQTIALEGRALAPLPALDATVSADLRLVRRA